MPRPSLAALLVTVLVVFGTAQTTTRSLSAQAPVVAPSAEETLLGLLPYRLTAADLPVGFKLLDESAVTPSSRAYDIGNTSLESLAVLKDLQQGGFVTGFHQIIGPNQVTPFRLFEYLVEQYTTEGKASEGLRSNLTVEGDSTTTVDTPALPVQLGDESGAVHIVADGGDGNGEGVEVLSWRRGRLVFTALVHVVDTTETIDQVVPLAQSADRRAAAAPPASTAEAATLPSAGSESYRVLAIYNLTGLLPSGGQAPIGLRPIDRGVVNNGDLIVAATNPRAEYDKIANRWKRVVAVRQSYGTLQGSTGDVLHIGMALSADMAGAAAELLDPGQHAGGDLETFALPAPLGDDGRLYHETYSTPDGVQREVWNVVWTHGRIVVAVATTGPAGDFGLETAADFAAIVEARLSRASLPDLLTAPLPAPPVSGVDGA